MLWFKYIFNGSSFSDVSEDFLFFLNKHCGRPVLIYMNKLYNVKVWVKHQIGSVLLFYTVKKTILA